MKDNAAITILVADDEHLMATGLVSSIQSLGYDVVGPESDGLSAMNRAKEILPDLMLLDIRMPEMDGLSIAKAMWEEYGVPSVMITAYADETYIKDAQETGVFGYLIKPVSAETLRVAISVGLARANAAADQHKRINQLERSLNDRRVIEQAKWKLVQEQNMTEPEAHNHLQHEARSKRVKLLDVARELIGESGEDAAKS